MLLSIGQALLGSTASSVSTYVTDVTNEETTHLEHSSHVSNARRGAEGFPQLGAEKSRPASASRGPKVVA